MLGTMILPRGAFGSLSVTRCRLATSESERFLCEGRCYRGIDSLRPPHSVLSCQIIEDSTTEGHDFRILGVASQ